MEGGEDAEERLGGEDGHFWALGEVLSAQLVSLVVRWEVIVVRYLMHKSRVGVEVEPRFARPASHNPFVLVLVLVLPSFRVHSQSTCSPTSLYHVRSRQ